MNEVGFKAVLRKLRLNFVWCVAVPGLFIAILTSAVVYSVIQNAYGFAFVSEANTYIEIAYRGAIKSSMPDSERQLDAAVRARMANGTLTSLRVASPGGVLVYSTPKVLVGEAQPLTPTEMAALDGATTTSLRAFSANPTVQVTGPLYFGASPVAVGAVSVVREARGAAAIVRLAVGAVLAIVAVGCLAIWLLAFVVTRRAEVLFEDSEASVIVEDERLEHAFSGVNASSLATAQTLMNVIDERDGFTAKHSVRVADLARAIAVRLPLPAEEVADVERAALLHDIGKVAMPESVLHATRGDPSTDALFREHPATGERMLRAIPGLEPLAPTVRAHHERIDGSGYPDSLMGEDIPRAARVIAVADAFDGMVAEHPHYGQERMAAEAAAQMLLDQAGRKYDPAAVQALVGELRASGMVE